MAKGGVGGGLGTSCFLIYFCVHSCFGARAISVSCNVETHFSLFMQVSQAFKPADLEFVFGGIVVLNNHPVSNTRVLV